jgi:putative oxidoreductase
MKILEDFLVKVLSEHIGKLILRLTLGVLMLFHGYKKIVHGIDGIKAIVSSHGFPEVLAYGSYIGEVFIPILIILGIFTRISSFIYAFTMAFAIYLVYSSNISSLTKTGGLLIETPLFFMLAAISLMFIGAGKYSVDRR